MWRSCLATITIINKLLPFGIMLCWSSYTCTATETFVIIIDYYNILLLCIALALLLRGTNKPILDSGL